MMLPLVDSMRNDPEENDKVFSALLDLANYQMDIGHADLSKKYFQRGKTYADLNKLFNIAKIHDVQYRIDSSDGNYLKALREYKLTRIADDSIYSLRKTNQFVQLQIQYETEAKDKNIELLVQKDKVQQATLRQSDLMKNSYTGGYFGYVSRNRVSYIVCTGTNKGETKR